MPRYVFYGPKISDRQVSELAEQGVEWQGVDLDLLLVEPDEAGPDDFICRNGCGKPVRYALQHPGSRMRATYDAAEVPNGPYRLEEEEVEGELTGNWVAHYVRAAERNGEPGRRQHDCAAKRKRPGSADGDR